MHPNAQQKIRKEQREKILRIVSRQRVVALEEEVVVAVGVGVVRVEWREGSSFFYPLDLESLITLLSSSIWGVKKFHGRSVLSLSVYDFVIVLFLVHNVTKHTHTYIHTQYAGVPIRNSGIRANRQTHCDEQENSEGCFANLSG